MQRSGNFQGGRFLQPASRQEGCEWTVYVNLAAVAPVARACKIEELPRNVTELRSARRSCQMVAQNIAERMNASRHTD